MPLVLLQGNGLCHKYLHVKCLLKNRETFAQSQNVYEWYITGFLWNQTRKEDTCKKYMYFFKIVDLEGVVHCWVFFPLFFFFLFGSIHWVIVPFVVDSVCLKYFYSVVCNFVPMEASEWWKEKFRNIFKKLVLEEWKRGKLYALIFLLGLPWLSKKKKN